jgi:hypothetical protein
MGRGTAGLRIRFNQLDIDITSTDLILAAPADHE